MKRLLAIIGGALCLLGVVGCLQGLEDHSRFLTKPPILRQAMAGDLEAVKMYVQSGGDVNVTDQMGNTLLMFAVADDHVAIVKYLLANGANSERQNKMGETALEIAKRGAPKRVTRLLETVPR